MTPTFRPDVPEPLLHGATQRDRWMYEQQSIQRQQNDWIIMQLQDGKKRFEQADHDRAKMRAEVTSVSERLMLIEQLKDRLLAKSSVIAAITCLLAIPVMMAFISSWFTRLWEKIWK